MSFIEVKGINKTFKVPLKGEGRYGSLKSFFNRKYKYIEAIKDISFSVKRGEIVGYIGPNGAGKSTTIKILSGILVPDSGNVTINHMTPWKNRKKYVSEIGVVFGQRSLLKFLPIFLLKMPHAHILFFHFLILNLEALPMMD